MIPFPVRARAPKKTERRENCFKHTNHSFLVEFESFFFFFFALQIDSSNCSWNALLLEIIEEWEKGEQKQVEKVGEKE